MKVNVNRNHFFACVSKSVVTKKRFLGVKKVVRKKGMKEIFSDV